MHVDRHEHTAGLRLAWLSLILLASIGGVLFPFYCVKRWSLAVLEAKWFAVLRAFATGLVCGVACLHILPDADEYLSKVPFVDGFPLANTLMLCGAFMMVAIKELGTMLMETLTSMPDSPESLEASLLQAEEARFQTPNSDAGASEMDTEFGHRHSHFSLELHQAQTGKSMRKRMIVYAMEASIAIHAVLIGLGLGVLHGGWAAVATLGTALMVHQFFEGVALGTSAAKAGLKLKQANHLIWTFSMSCPLGGAVGIAVDNWFAPKDPRTALVLGLLNALAAGTLLHIGFVELLAEDFSEENGRRHSKAWSFKICRLLALCSGGLVMAVLALYA